MEEHAVTPVMTVSFSFRCGPDEIVERLKNVFTVLPVNSTLEMSVYVEDVKK